MMQHRDIDGEPLVSNQAVERRERAIRQARIVRDHQAAAAVHAADDSPWFAFRVMSGRELSVENDMRKAGIESLVPMRKGRELRRRGRVSLPIIPVMNGYVLSRFEVSDDAFHGVLGMENVIGVIGGTGTPRPVSHCEVREFDARARNGHFDWSQCFTGMRVNNHCQVIHGPFKGAKGRVVSVRGDGLGDAVVEFFEGEKIPPALLPLALLNKL